MKWNLDKYIKGFYKEKYDKVLDKLSQKYGKENGEDIIQEALLKFSQYYNESKGDANKYLNKVIQNEAKKFIKKENRIKTTTLLYDVNDETIRIDEEVELEYILEESSQIFREALFNKYKNVAQKNNKTESAIKNKVYYERKKIRKRWED